MQYNPFTRRLLTQYALKMPDKAEGKKLLNLIPRLGSFDTMALIYDLFNRGIYHSQLAKAVDVKRTKEVGGENVWDFIRNASAMRDLRKFLKGKGLIAENVTDVKSLKDVVPESVVNDIVNSLTERGEITFIDAEPFAGYYRYDDVAAEIGLKHADLAKLLEKNKLDEVDLAGEAL